jgi:transposase
MEVVYPRCCGLDVHRKSVTACVLVTEAGRARPRTEIRAFPTMPADLLALGDWLAAADVTHVAMESTGVYWKPIWAVLEDRFALLLVNAQHVKAVPGRKTDVRDAEWLADLLRHGLLRASFVPDADQRGLRDLTRLRTVRVRARAAELNRLQATLEKAGLKPAVVVSEIDGVSARRILAAILGGEADAAVLADLATGRLRAKLADLERALAAIPTAHDQWLIAEHLAMLDDLDAVIARLDALIAEELADDGDEVGRLDTIPGIDRRVAEGILAEVGTEVDRFPTSKHLASWAGLCPGNDQSAGCPVGDAPQRQDPQREPVAALAAVRGGQRGGADQGHLPRGPVPPAGDPAGQTQGDDRRGAQHPGPGLLPAAGRDDLRRTRQQLLRRAGRARRPPPPHPPPGAPRVRRHARPARRRLMRFARQSIRFSHQRRTSFVQCDDKGGRLKSH